MSESAVSNGNMKEDEKNVEINVETSGALEVNDLEAALMENNISNTTIEENIEPEKTSSERITVKKKGGGKKKKEEVVQNIEEVEEVDEQQENLRKDFEDRAESMGLTILGNGCFTYQDDFSSVMYRKLSTLPGENTPMANYIIPHLSVFTKSNEENSQWEYQGPISNIYKFEGNGNLINTVKESIGLNNVMTEDNYLSNNFCSMRHDIVIRNSQNVPQVGDIYPIVSIRNSYDGTKSADITFGMSFNHSNFNIKYASRTKFGYIRQLHIDSSPTQVHDAITLYVSTFTNNIHTIIQDSMSAQISEADMMKLLSMIEAKTGKRRKEEAIDIINEDLGTENRQINGWTLFKALSKFTCLQKNINSRVISEDIIERVLVIPQQMLDVVESLKHM